jgi:hypothetical protein
MSQETKEIDFSEKYKPLIEERYHEYLAKGYTTQPAPRERVEKSICAIYEREGLAKPNFQWVLSPMEAKRVLAEHGINNHATNLWGSLDLYWIAYYKVAQEIAEKEGIELFTQKDLTELDDLETIGAGSFWWPFDDVLICETPNELHVDANGSLHNDDGPAMAYRDGEKVWMIHGVEVNEQIVMAPKTLTTDQITSESNAEKKRIMIERFGPAEYAEAVGAKILDQDILTLAGSAPRLLVEIEGGGKWMIGTDGGTGRVYWMSVAPEARTCKEAHESIAFVDETKIISQS